MCSSHCALVLSLVPQVRELVPDGPPIVTLGQANHLAAQDKVLYLVLGLRDQAQYIQVGWTCEPPDAGLNLCASQVGWTCEEGVDNMVACLKQEHLESNDVGRNVGQFNRTLGREG